MLSAEYFGDIFLLKTESDAIVFLVNMQQAEVIREQTSYQVGHYCGEMGQDFWDARRWQREFETKQVMRQCCFSRFSSCYVSLVNQWSATIASIAT